MSFVITEESYLLCDNTSIYSIADDCVMSLLSIEDSLCLCYVIAVSRQKLKSSLCLSYVIPVLR